MNTRVKHELEFRERILMMYQMLVKVKHLIE